MICCLEVRTRPADLLSFKPKLEKLKLSIGCMKLHPILLALSVLASLVSAGGCKVSSSCDVDNGLDHYPIKSLPSKSKVDAKKSKKRNKKKNKLKKVKKESKFSSSRERNPTTPLARSELPPWLKNKEKDVGVKKVDYTRAPPPWTTLHKL
jgi:hypothetical protein